MFLIGGNFVTAVCSVEGYMLDSVSDVQQMSGSNTSIPIPFTSPTTSIKNTSNLKSGYSKVSCVCVH